MPATPGIAGWHFLAAEGAMDIHRKR
jgi:hypothetical protein